MKTVFVTGAGGYAGNRAVDHFRARGLDVVAGVRNRARKLAYERAGIRSLVCDVADPINVARAIASVHPDAVLHLAGPSRADGLTRDPIESFQGCCASWVYVLDAVRRANPRARVVLVSAADAQYSTVSPNGQTESNASRGAFFADLKHAGESLAACFHRAFQLDLSIARPYWYTGPNQPEAAYFSNAVRRIRDAVTQGQNEVPISDLDVPRDVMHIDDVVAAYERILADGKPAAVYDVCSGSAATARELLTGLAERHALRVSLVNGDADASSRATVTGPGNPQRLRDELQWEAPHRAADAVAELWESLVATNTRPGLVGAGAS